MAPAEIIALTGQYFVGRQLDAAPDAGLRGCRGRSTSWVTTISVKTCGYSSRWLPRTSTRYVVDRPGASCRRSTRRPSRCTPRARPGSSRPGCRPGSTGGRRRRYACPELGLASNCIPPSCCEHDRLLGGHRVRLLPVRSRAGSSPSPLGRRLGQELLAGRAGRTGRRARAARRACRVRRPRLARTR